MRNLSKWIVPIKKCTQSNLCGGKALRLGQMIRYGYDVPPGHVLLDPLRQLHLERCGLLPAIKEVERRLPTASPEELVSRGATIRENIEQSNFDLELRNALEDFYIQHWQGKKLVVRSSAHGEDSTHHSFAGQLDSFLGVHTFAELETAVRNTWASLWSQRCILYQHHNNLYLRHMGVIVQEQVDALYSGVLFTHAPGDIDSPKAMLAEYCQGLADALVSGEMNPGEILFERRTGNIIYHSRPPESGSDCDILTQKNALSALTKGALALESKLNLPLDIEWSISLDGQVYFLQARPITAKMHQDEQSIVWTNANIAENFPEPVTPFLYSVALQGYAAYFRNLGLGFGISPKRIQTMQDALDHIIGVHGGRLYYNLTNIHTLLYLAPAGRWLTRFFNDFVGATEFPSPRHAPAQLGRLEQAAEWLRILFNVPRQYLTVERRVSVFEKRIDDFCNRTRLTDLSKMALADLRTHLRGFLDIRLHYWNNAALADTAAMICYGLLKLALARVLPEKEAGNLHNDLLKGLSDLASGAPVQKLWELSRQVRNSAPLHQLFSQNEADAIWQSLEKPEFVDFRLAFLDYIENWGFRSSSELMLTVPSPEEKPAETLALLKVFVERSGSSPAEMLNKQMLDRDHLSNQLFSDITPSFWKRRLPLISHAWWIRKLLIATQASIRLRERARFRQARLYVRLRQIIMTIGNQLHQSGMIDSADDLFFLTYGELDELLAGHAMFPHSIRTLVAERRRALQEIAKTVPPDHFTLTVGDYLPLHPKAESTKPMSTEQNGRLQGAAVSGGRITAKATVLRSASEGHSLQEGDILVTRQSDPGWASVFFLVRGLIVERGGMLSHGAIIAREYGIPAVVGVVGATQAIQTGSRVSLDGDRGIVDLL